MNDRPHCSQCGAPLPAHAPGRRCPRCLLQFALDPAAAEAGVAPDPNRPHVHYFGDYELLGEIARGGMGVVYKARQVSLNRFVAVKVLLAGQFSSADYIKRFRTEAEAAANLQHSNIVAIHEVGEHDGQQYFAMEYIAGSNLAEIVRDRPVAPRRAALLTQTIAAAVHHAHQRGVIHRDLKPSNVLIDANDQPHVTDFGLAKIVLQSSGGESGQGSARSETIAPTNDLTATGQILGTPGFMPPEQASGVKGSAEAVLDIYSLGAILYFLLTTRAPFVADTIEATLRQVIEVEPVSPRLLNPEVRPDLETICLKCLEKDPLRRFVSAQELADELGRFLAGQPIDSRPISRLGKLWRWCRRKPVVALLGVSLLAAVGLGVLGIQWQLHRAQVSELAARRNAYAANMNLAQVSLEGNNLRRARELLDRNRPQPGQLDLRGWEWRRVWKECQSDALASFSSGLKRPMSMSFLPGESRLFVGSSVGEIARLQFGQDVRATQTALPKSDQFAVVAASLDGKFLAMTRDRGVAVVCDREGNRLSVNLKHGSHIASLSFSADGQWLATSALDGQVKIWIWRSGELLRTVPGPRARAMYFGDVTFSPVGRWLALGQANGRLRLIDPVTGSERWNVPAHQDQISALAFSSDGRLLATGSGYGETSIKIWDAETGEARAGLDGHTSWISGLTFSPDGRQLASSSADQTVRLWEAEPWRQTKVFRGHLKEVHCLAFFPSGERLASADLDGVVNVWEVTRTPRQVYPARISERSGLVRLLQDDTNLFWVDGGEVVVSDANTFQEIKRLPSLGTNNTAMSILNDERLLAVGDRTGRIKVWDLWGRRSVANFPAHTNQVRTLAFSRDGKTLASSGLDRHTKSWNVADWSAASSWEWEPGLTGENSQFVHRGRSWATVHRGHVKIWDVATGKLIVALPKTSSPVDDVATSPDGRWFAIGCQSGEAIILDARTWKPAITLHGHLTGVHGVTFSPDSARLATGSNGREAVKLWDTTTWLELATFPSQGSLFQPVFSPSGQTLIAISNNRRLHLWRAPSLQEINRAENQTATPSDH